jgi:hypothetical protein
MAAFVHHGCIYLCINLGPFFISLVGLAHTPLLVIAYFLDLSEELDVAGRRDRTQFDCETAFYRWERDDYGRGLELAHILNYFGGQGVARERNLGYEEESGSVPRTD